MTDKPIEHVEWESDTTILVKLTGLRSHPKEKYSKKPGRNKAVFVHHAAGGVLEGIRAPMRIADYHVADPKWATNPDGSLKYKLVGGKKKPVAIGGGKGWPGIAYPFIVPTIPEVRNGKYVVYRCHEDDVWSYHTGSDWNYRAVGVCFAGWFQSRHAKHDSDKWLKPSDQALAAGTDLILSYLLPRYGLKPTDVKGHFDAGKPTCPGDFLEQWVRHVRGEHFPDPRQDFVWAPDRPAVPSDNKRSLKTTAEKQQALIELGYDLGASGADGVAGFYTRAAVEAVQENFGLVVDGIWGPRTEAAVREALAAL